MENLFPYIIFLSSLETQYLLFFDNQIFELGPSLMHEFMKVGSIDEFNHKNYKCFRFMSKAIGIFKEKNGDFYAIEANCKHQNANLLAQPLKGDIAVCQRHGWKFNMKTGECLTEAWAKLRKFDLKINDKGEIWISKTPREDEPDDDLMI